VDIPETLTIEDFLSFAGDELGLNIIYDPAKVKGDVAGKFRGTMEKKNVYRLLESIVWLHGYEMKREGDVVTIWPVAESDVVSEAPTLMEEGAKEQTMAELRRFELGPGAGEASLKRRRSSERRWKKTVKVQTLGMGSAGRNTGRASRKRPKRLLQNVWK